MRSKTRRTSIVVVLLALAVVGAGTGFAIYSFAARESRAHTTNTTAAGQGLVVRWVRTGRSYRIQRSCGFIEGRGNRVAVDIAEGHLPLTCAAARAVMSRYLARSFVRYGTVRYGTRRFECYKSRPDGEGWDFNCAYSRSASDAYVDVGGGRRPYR
jgi:hypothetical protein